MRHWRHLQATCAERLLLALVCHHVPRPVVAILVLALTLSGCGGGSTPSTLSAPLSPTLTPTRTPTPTGPSPAGNWAGSINDPVSGPGTLQLSLADSQPGTPVVVWSGPWSATFASGETVSGTAQAQVLSSTRYTISLSLFQPGFLQEYCVVGGGNALIAFSLTSSVVTASRLTAVSARFLCSAPLSPTGFGSVSLSRQ